MMKAILMGAVVVITTALLTWLLVSLSIAKAVDIREKQILKKMIKNIVHEES